MVWYDLGAARNSGTGGARANLRPDSGSATPNYLYGSVKSSLALKFKNAIDLPKFFWK